MSTPKFSQTSLDRLATCHPDLQRLFMKVGERYNCTILCGHRGQGDQDAAFASGNSKLKWPDSEHNYVPSRAVDAMPYPVNWQGTKENLCKLYHFVGYVLATADSMGIKIRCGADFNRNKVFFDDNFIDIVHFELC